MEEVLLEVGAYEVVNPDYANESVPYETAIPVDASDSSSYAPIVRNFSFLYVCFEISTV